MNKSNKNHASIFCHVKRLNHYIHLSFFLHVLLLMLDKISVSRNQMMFNPQTNMTYLVMKTKLIYNHLVSWTYAIINDTSSSSSADTSTRKNLIDKTSPTVNHLLI